MKTALKLILLLTLICLVVFSGCSWAEVGVPEVNGKLWTSSQDYLQDIAEGNVPGRYPWLIFGANPDVDNAEETIWSVGGVYTPPDSGMQLELVSTSIEDSGPGGVNPAGTGVRQVLITYLNTSFIEYTEIVTLDGTTVVTTTATDIYRINDFRAVWDQIGSNDAAVGTIDLRHLADTPIYARIDVGKHISPQTFWTVPHGKKLYLTQLITGGGHSSGNRFIRFIFSASTSLGESTNGILYDSGYWPVQDGSINVPITVPGGFVCGVDIRLNCVSDAVNSDALVSASIIGWLQDEEC